MWVSADAYLITHKVTGRQDRYTVPRSDLYDPNELAEVIASVEAYAEKDLAEPEEVRARKPKAFRLELGKQLMGIKASQQHQRESQHSRWWQGVR